MALLALPGSNTYAMTDSDNGVTEHRVANGNLRIAQTIIVQGIIACCKSTSKQLRTSFTKIDYRRVFTCAPL